MKRRTIVLLHTLAAVIAFAGVLRAAVTPATESYLRAAARLPNLHGQTARLALGQPIDCRAFDEAFRFLATRGDLVDFRLSDLMRILYLHGNDGKVPADLKARIEQAVLDFRYWLYPDDRNVSSSACFWTENHQLVYHTIEYLAGQRYSRRIFALSGRTGAWHKEHARRRLLTWMAIRARYGFSEWLAPGYYDHDLDQLIALVDFADDPSLVRAARGLADLLLLEMALHSFDGALRGTAGRTYTRMLEDVRNSATTAVIALAFGLPAPGFIDSNGAIALATTRRYHVPPVVERIARWTNGPLLIRQRSGWTVEDALATGFDPRSRIDIFHFWGFGAYDGYPGIAAATDEACRFWNIRGRKEGAKARPRSQVDTENKALFGANIESYRTRDYILSTVQDFRKGKPGYQQHVWSASLGGLANVWTNHPGSDNETSRPNFWAGNSVLPRAAQDENIAVVIHRVPADDPRPYSHAYFPTKQFDETSQEAGWLFGRRGGGFIALAAFPASQTSTDSAWTGIEWISRSHDSAWICIVGNAASDGSYERFKRRVAGAKAAYSHGKLLYSDSSATQLSFGWDGDFVINGRPEPLTDYPRLEAPFGSVGWGQTHFTIKAGTEQYRIDLSDLPAPRKGTAKEASRRARQ